MKNKKTLRYVAVIMVACIAFVVFAGCSENAASGFRILAETEKDVKYISADDVQKVKEGMTMEEVVSLFGPAPNENNVHYPKGLEWMTEDGGCVYVLFRVPGCETLRDLYEHAEKAIPGYKAPDNSRHVNGPCLSEEQMRIYLDFLDWVKQSFVAEMLGITKGNHREFLFGSWVDSSSSSKADPEKIMSVVPEMTLEEVVDILGRANRSTGLSELTCEWDLTDSRVFTVMFEMRDTEDRGYVNYVRECNIIEEQGD